MGKMTRIEQLRACAAAAKNFAIGKVLEAVDSMSGDIEELAEEIAALRREKAEVSHTHSEYAASNHTHAIYSVGTTAPGDTKLLWIDTTAGGTGGLKYHNGSDWVAVPVAWG